MKRMVNCSAGPATLPLEVLQQVQSELLDWQGCGMSVMEMSHRGKEFISIAQQAEADLREDAGITANYKVLFMQGGATGQFTLVPTNLLRGKQGNDVVLAGYWGKQETREQRRARKCNTPASNAADKYPTWP